jgi:sugar lactone lactonase YvrE
MSVANFAFLSLRMLICISFALTVRTSSASVWQQSDQGWYIIRTVSESVSPNGIAIGPSGEIYVASNKHQIFRSDDGVTFTAIAGLKHQLQIPVDPAPIPEPLFSGDGGPALDAYLDSPEGIAIGFDGTVYFADSRNHRIRGILKSGTIETIAGTGEAGFGGDGGPARGAKLNYPKGLSIDENGNLYVADSGNHRIRMIQSAGTITTVAGNGKAGYSGDGGIATKARLHMPSGVFAAALGVIYIADTANVRIRRVQQSGIIHTISGTGKQEINANIGLATRVPLFSPKAVAVDVVGNLFIADWANGVRRISPDGIIKTIAGEQIHASSNWGNGGPGTARTLYSSAIALASNGSIHTNHRGWLMLLTPDRH